MHSADVRLARSLEQLRGTHQEFSVRVAAARELTALLRSEESVGRTGDETATYIRALVTAFRTDPEWRVRAAAADALLVLLDVRLFEIDGPYFDALKAGLWDEEPVVRVTTAELLGRLEDDRDHDLKALGADVLAGALADAHNVWWVRLAAVQALGRLGPLDDRFLEALVDSLRDSNWQVRCAAAQAINKLDPDRHPQKVTEALDAALGDPVWRVRYEAASAVGAMRVSACAGRVASLLRSDTEWRVREAAALALAALRDSIQGQVVRDLISALGDSNAKVRHSAVQAVGSIGDGLIPHAEQMSARLRLLVDSAGSSHEAEIKAIRDAFRIAANPEEQPLTLDAVPDKDAGSVSAISVKSAWGKGVDQVVRHFSAQVVDAAKVMNGASARAAKLAETALDALGVIALPYMVSRVAKAREVVFEERMAVMRGLSCTSTLPVDVICAFLSEWIYGPAVVADTPRRLPGADNVPVVGLELLELQTPKTDEGINTQWALLRGSGVYEKTWYLVFRGTESGLDWLQNSDVSLKGIEVNEWGTLLVHGGYWSSVDSDGPRLREALKRHGVNPTETTLAICGGSKGGASALLLGIWLLAPRRDNPGGLGDTCRALEIITFGCPNIVGRGNEEHTKALECLRDALRREAPNSRAWLFEHDPVVAMMSKDSKSVMLEYRKEAHRAANLLKWIQPSLYEKAAAFLAQTVTVTGTFEPILSECILNVPPSVHLKRKFDAAMHPQVNYTEALCRLLRLKPAASVKMEQLLIVPPLSRL